MRIGRSHADGGAATGSRRDDRRGGRRATIPALAALMLGMAGSVWAARADGAAAVTRDFPVSADSASERAIPFVRVVLDKDAMTYAQSLRVRLIVVSAPGDSITWPGVADAWDTFRIASASEPAASLVSEIRTSSSGALEIATERTLVLEPMIAEAHEIPIMEFVVTSDGAPGPVVIRTEPMAVQVRSILSGSADDPSGSTGGISGGIAGEPEQGADPGMMGELAAIQADRDLRPVMFGVLGVAGAGALAYGSVRLARRRRTRGSVSPRERAERQIREAFSADGTPRESASAAMRSLDEALRVYVARVYGVDAADLTTPRLVAQLGARAAAPTAELARAFEQFDVAKFSGAPVSAEDALAARRDVEALLARVGMDEPAGEGKARRARA